MFKRLEFVMWVARGAIRRISRSVPRRAEARWLVDKVEEFVRRVRRAGLLFIGIVAGLLALSLAVHPISPLLWFIALPLVGLASLLSMLWPSKPFRKRTPAQPSLADVAASTRARLARSRSEIPLASRPAFDLIVRRVAGIERLAGDRHDALLSEEMKRLVGQHLPRLVESFVALPTDERTGARADALADGLGAIGEELGDLNDRLLASRTDRFEIERQFIASRFPRRNGLAGI